VVDLGGSAAETCTTVAAIINNPASPTFGYVIATVVGVGATAITTVQAVTPLTGGTGTGLWVRLAGLFCTVYEIDESAAPVYTLKAMTPDLTPLAGSAGDKLLLEHRAGSKLTAITLTHG